MPRAPIFEPLGVHTASYWMRSPEGLSTRARSVDGDAPTTISHAHKRVEKPRGTSRKDSEKVKTTRKCTLCGSNLCSKCTTIMAMDPKESEDAPKDNTGSSRPVKPRLDIAKRPRTALICSACAAKRRPHQQKDQHKPSSHHHREHQRPHRTHEYGHHHSHEDGGHRSLEHDHHCGDHHDRQGLAWLSYGEDYSPSSSASEDARGYFSNHRWPKERVAWGHPKHSSSRHRSATASSKGSDSSSHRSRGPRDRDADSHRSRQFDAQSDANAPISLACMDGVSRREEKPPHYFDLTTRSSEATGSAHVRRYTTVQRDAEPSRQEAGGDLERLRRRSARNMKLLMHMRDHYSERATISLPSSPALPMPGKMHRSRLLKPSALLSPLSSMSASSPAHQQYSQHSESMPFLQPVAYPKVNPLDLGYLYVYKDAI